MLKYITKIPSTPSFNFPVNIRIGWDSSTSFLNKFIQGLVGENLLTNAPIKSFVEDIDTRFQWKPDNQRELQMNEVNNGEKCFGIIEFTVTSEK
jgi:hypothetical protein